MYDTHDMQQETFCSLNVAGTSLGRQFALLQHQLLGFQLEDGHCWEGSCGLLSIVYNAKVVCIVGKEVVVCCIFICQADNDVMK